MQYQIIRNTTCHQNKFQQIFMLYIEKLHNLSVKLLVCLWLIYRESPQIGTVSVEGAKATQPSLTLDMIDTEETQDPNVDVPGPVFRIDSKCFVII